MTSVHLTNAWHGESGGVRRHYLDLLATADEMDWRMRLIVPGVRTGVERVGRLGRIYTVRAPTALAFDRRYRLLLPPAYLRPSRGAIVRILRRERADIIETADKFCLPYLSALVRKGLVPGLGRPTLVGHSTERLDAVLGAHVARNDLTRAFARWYMRAIYVPPFDFHVANSPYTADEIGAALPPHRRDVLHVVSPGVEVAVFEQAVRSDVARARWTGISDGSVKVIGYAGRLSREKHTDALIAMMERLGAWQQSDVRLLIAGDGPDRQRLEARAGAVAPGRVVFLGHLATRPLLATFLASLDVFVHPNPAEPFGIGPLEAMAASTPVVMPRGGGVLTYADDSNAWLADESGGESLAVALVSALRCPDPSRRVAGQTTARRFDRASQARRYFELLQRLHDVRRGALAEAMGSLAEASRSSAC